MIKEILEYNRQFVERKSYEQFATDKYPNKRLAIVTCMDTRLIQLLPAALGLKNGDFKIIKNAGGTIKDIHILPCFEETPPEQLKMERKERYFNKRGLFHSEIILDDDNNLIDGYTSYLLAKQIGLESVIVRYGRRQTIKAYHRPGGKLYEWELPQKLTDRVLPGDRVLVHTEYGVRFVTVAAVEQYKPQERTQTLRRAIRVIKGGGAV